MNENRRQFRKRIQLADESSLDFQFVVVYSKDEYRLLVTVYKSEQKITFFNMQKKQGQWRIIDAPKVNDRFFQIEKLLDAAIKDFERKKGL